MDGSSIFHLTQLLDKNPSALLAKYKDGCSLLHIAVLCDRVDVFEWLVSTYDMDIYAVDGYGRNVSSLAQNAGSTKCENAIIRIKATRKIRGVFIEYLYRRRDIALKKLRHKSSVTIQAVVRRHQAYTIYSPILLSSKTVRVRSRMTWVGVIKSLNDMTLKKNKDKQLAFSWMHAKTQYDLVAGDIDVDEELPVGGIDRDNQDEGVLDDLIVAAAVMVIDRNSCSGDEEEEEVMNKGLVDGSISSNKNITTPIIIEQPIDSIELTQSVVKWLEKADSKYRDMFRRVVEKLANGERSYALSKRLSHCIHPVFEAKLDAGQRILWTKVQRGERRATTKTKFESIMVSL